MLVQLFLESGRPICVFKQSHALFLTVRPRVKGIKCD